FVAMSVAGLTVELLFKVLGWVPLERHATVTEAHIVWNYTTILNIIFLALAAILVWRAATTGGFKMLRMMNMAPSPDGSRRVRPSAARRTCSHMSRMNEHWLCTRAPGIDPTDRFANLTSEVSRYASSALSNRFEPEKHISRAILIMARLLPPSSKHGVEIALD